MKKVVGSIVYFFVFTFFCALFVWSFESGQRKVDAWEQETGRYGEGLR